MADIKINLLPWREQLREEKKQEFIKILVMVLAFAGAIIFGFDRFYNGEIDTQKRRNNFLQSEIAVLEEKIEEINNLQQKRNELLSRMRVIQDLQGNRPIIVRVFDELARRLADRVFYLSLQMRGGELTISGVAESNPRISNQLREFDDSEWFARPNVTTLVADRNYGAQASRFNLTVQQTTPKKE